MRFPVLRNFRIAFAAAITCILCVSCYAQSLPPVKTETSLEDDVRLQKRVSVEATGISIEELLSRLSSADLRLSAGRSCALQKVQVRLKQRPLLQVMQSLATMLPGNWQPKDKQGGYTLNLSVRAIDRRDAWWRALLHEREVLREPQIAFVLHIIQSEPPHAGNEEAAVSQKQFEAKWRFFRLLPPDLQRRIAAERGSDIRQYCLNGSNTISFVIPRSGTAADVILPFLKLPEPAQKQVRELAGEFDSTWAYVRFRNTGSTLEADLLKSEGEPVRIGYMELLRKPVETELPLDHRFLPAARAEGQLPPSWQLFMDYQKSAIWKNDAPDTTLHQPTQRPMKPPRRADVLNWLGEKGDMEFIADYYSQPCVPMPIVERGKPLAGPLKAELDFWAAEEDMSWKRTRNDLYLFRNNRWYRDDYLEVPASELRKLTALLPTAEDAKRSVDVKQSLHSQWPRITEIMRALTLWQIGNGLAYAVQEEEPGQPFDPKKPKYLWRPFAELASAILAQYDILRFYTDLPPDAQEQLRAGTLPLSSLSAAQQQQALALLSGPLQHIRGALLQLRSAFPGEFVTIGANPGPRVELPIQFQIVLIPPPMQTQ